MTATTDSQLDADSLRAEVRDTYRRVAERPQGDYHFHRGPGYAAWLLRYDPAELESLPGDATARFAGVGNPLRVGAIHPGETVVDLGCGAGTDLLLAAHRVGPTGRAIGVDMTEAMRRRAVAAARAAGLAGRVDVREGVVESLPVEDASVDVVISNGVVNLTADKRAVFREIHRILRPGGRLFLADVVVQRPIRADARSRAELWAACVAGALSVNELHAHATAAGLVDGRIVEWFDAYRDTSAEQKVSRDLRVRGANFFARKPNDSAGDRG